ncbi:unnamed protein product [Protopolystoma xenopodis]|uniref:Uncharacterized protein n=1 Tax=Protopolystoma xenopodis TaxID=117903 RepID=A0A3S5CEA2_9PLAT|nr:unnamed protein product [Protopolystoma xenopodis]
MGGICDAYIDERAHVPAGRGEVCSAKEEEEDTSKNVPKELSERREIWGVRFICPGSALSSTRLLWLHELLKGSAKS